VCGGLVDAPPAVDGPPKKTDPGCCDAGPPRGSSIVLGLGVLALLLAPRRRQRLR
jgi:uncharacterized protein (TIGR03382 family)